jgi:hypothetical protein
MNNKEESASTSSDEERYAQVRLISHAPCTMHRAGFGV